MLPRKKRISYAEIEKYRLPVYNKNGAEKYVSFYVLDPDSVAEGHPRLKRIKKKFNSYHNKRDRDAAALRFCHEVAIKLQSGWNPLIDECGKSSFVSWELIHERYQTYMKKLLKDDVIKLSTYQNYSCRMKLLQEWNASLNHPLMYAYQFNRSLIETFLEHIYLDRDTTPKTRNNYLNWLSSVCSWMIGNGYLSSDPTEGIQKLREKEKFRKALSSEDIERLQAYLEKTDKHYLLACLMHYYTLVRPNELTYIRLCDISLKEQSLFISHTYSKNRRDAIVTIPAKVIKLMLELDVFSSPDDYYLFGNNFWPSEHKASGRIFRERWVKVRKALNFPESYQFYSLKDTGITDTIDKVGLSVAKDQARHASVATTNKYVRKEQLTAHAELKNFEGNL